MTAATHIDPAHMARMLNAASLNNLSATNLQALCHIAAADGSLRMLSIADKINLSTAAVTNIADSLEALGYIKRQPSRADRRSIHLFITDAGQAALAEILNVQS